MKAWKVPTVSWSALVAHQALETLPHRPRRLVGEGHRQDAVGADAAHPHQVGHPVSDHPGLAAPGPGGDQEGPLDGLDCLPLGGVQSFEDRLRCGHIIGWNGPSSILYTLTMANDHPSP